MATNDIQHNVAQLQSIFPSHNKEKLLEALLTAGKNLEAAVVLLLDSSICESGEFGGTRDPVIFTDVSQTTPSTSGRPKHISVEERSASHNTSSSAYPTTDHSNPKSLMSGVQASGYKSKSVNRARGWHAYSEQHDLINPMVTFPKPAPSLEESFPPLDSGLRDQPCNTQKLQHHGQLSTSQAPAFSSTPMSGRSSVGNPLPSRETDTPGLKLSQSSSYSSSWQQTGTTPQAYKEGQSVAKSADFSGRAETFKSPLQFSALNDHTNQCRLEALSQLKSQYPGIDQALLQELLEGFMWNAEKAVAWLKEDEDMLNDAGGHDSDNHQSLEHGAERGNGHHDEVEAADGSSTMMWQGLDRDAGDDLYSTFRKDALRMSRSRDRHLRSAIRAFSSGDHARARELSNQAKEERQLAVALHSEAAQKILSARNRGRPGGVWELDLHGLHADEAVAAVQERLCFLEAGSRVELKATEGDNSDSSRKQPPPVNTRPLAAARTPVILQELMIVTGVGLHSRKGGPSLPAAISNFLVNEQYSFRTARAGVLAVRPKKGAR